MLTPSYKRDFPSTFQKTNFYLTKIYTFKIYSTKIFQQKIITFFVRNWQTNESPKGFNRQQKSNLNIET